MRVSFVLSAVPRTGRCPSVQPDVLYPDGCGSDATNKVYLRPETAQGIFVDYLSVQKTGRMKLPFGICQIGKGFP